MSSLPIPIGQFRDAAVYRGDHEVARYHLAPVTQPWALVRGEPELPAATLDALIGARVDDPLAPLRERGLRLRLSGLRASALESLREAIQSQLRPRNELDVEWRWVKARYADAVSNAGLTVRPDQQLAGWAFHEGMGGNGVVWAFDHDADLPDTLSTGDSHLEPVVPAGARPPMSAVGGRWMPVNLLRASLLHQELLEFAAAWHGVSWGACDVIDEPPDGHWTTPASELPLWVDLCPDGHAIVRYVYYSPVGQACLIEQVDRYAVGSFVAESQGRVMEVGEGGMVW